MIDAVTNSYGNCHHVTCGLLAPGVYLNSPVEATRAATERGQTIGFAADNGLLGLLDIPQLTYTSSEAGPDWIITVGANEPGSDQNYLGSAKPVDISSVGFFYPSAGGETAAGTGTHDGTSNAAPVVIGTFAKVLSEVRSLLGDHTPGHAGGVVASGAPIRCGDAVPSCVLGDGVLTRAEWWRVVFENVLPAPQALVGGTIFPTIPTTEHASYYQGHGAIIGRLDGEDAWHVEWTRMVDNARGDAPPFDRPAGERNWFTVDSKCRQRLWESWSGGYYAGDEPDLDPIADPLASAFDAWCSAL